MTHDSDRREAALDWLVRTNDPEFDRWDEFTAWLEQSPGNADAYHSLAGAEAEMLPLVEAAPDAGETPKRRPVRRGMALAASVAALAALTTAVIAPRMMPVDYSTGSGEIRVIALGGQDELVMNGETRLQLSGWDLL